MSASSGSDVDDDLGNASTVVIDSPPKTIQQQEEPNTVLTKHLPDNPCTTSSDSNAGNTDNDAFGISVVGDKEVLEEDSSLTTADTVEEAHTQNLETSKAQENTDEIALEEPVKDRAVLEEDSSLTTADTVEEEHIQNLETSKTQQNTEEIALEDPVENLETSNSKLINDGIAVQENIENLETNNGKEINQEIASDQSDEDIIPPSNEKKNEEIRSNIEEHETLEVSISLNISQTIDHENQQSISSDQDEQQEPIENLETNNNRQIKDEIAIEENDKNLDTNNDKEINIDIASDQSEENIVPQSNEKEIEETEISDEYKTSEVPISVNDVSPTIDSENQQPTSTNQDKQQDSHENLVQNKTLNILQMNEPTKIKFGLLIGLIKVSEITENDIFYSVFHLLVGGQFNPDHNFVIESPESVSYFMEVVEACDSTVKAQLWSTLIVILKKSKQNLAHCTEANLISRVLHHLPEADDLVADLLLQILVLLGTFSIRVQEAQLLLHQLTGDANGRWPQHASKLLALITQVQTHQTPDEFFILPGSPISGISIPPISKWPSSGWTFNCWLQMDAASDERRQSYLYWFRTSKGQGYTAHLQGDSIVLTLSKAKVKDLQHGVTHQFDLHKWYMVTMVYVYNRWSKSEVRCYVNGVQLSVVEWSWLVGGNEVFDRCAIGCPAPSPDQPQPSPASFTGLLSSVYCFGVAMSPQQVAAVHALGPEYRGQLKYEAEWLGRLSEQHRLVLTEAKLGSSIVFLYNPAACDRQLCLNQGPKSDSAVFAHSPHALMTGEVKAIRTQSIHSALHSLGGVAILYPLFEQLITSYRDLHEGHPPDVGGQRVDSLTVLLISAMLHLVETSPLLRHQFGQNQGYLLMADYLERLISSVSDHEQPEHTTTDNESDPPPPIACSALLVVFVDHCRHLMSVGAGATDFLRHIYDHIFFNPTIWIGAPVEVQIELYEFLSKDFLGDQAQISSLLRRSGAVHRAMHVLRHHYWVESVGTPAAPGVATPQSGAGQPRHRPKPRRPAVSQLMQIRCSLLNYVRQLLLKPASIQDDELQAIFNLLTADQPALNLRDLLHFTVGLMVDQPSSMVPAFDRLPGTQIVLQLLTSHDEELRISALKLLGYFLMRSTPKRKMDSMNTHNLFAMIGEKLHNASAYLTMGTYNTLFELLTEKLTQDIRWDAHEDPDSSYKFENPAVLKLIANLINQSKETLELDEIRTLFLTDIGTLCKFGRENRRTLLQQSVWQDWLFSLSPIYPAPGGMDEQRTKQVLDLFRQLLHHAIQWEVGGWRVWIDTLAVIHSTIAREDFRLKTAQMYEEFEQQQQQVREVDSAPAQDHDGPSQPTGDKQERGADDGQEETTRRSSVLSSGGGGSTRHIFTSGPRAPPFRLPDFTWSHIHTRLVHSVLAAIESDLHLWDYQRPLRIAELVENPEKRVYVINLIHLVSQLTDCFVTAAGGLLPLLAVATSPTGEVDMLEGGDQGIGMSESGTLLNRIAQLAEALILANLVSLPELEVEKNMTNGGILRQYLRLVCTCAARQCLKGRYEHLFRLREDSLESIEDGEEVADSILQLYKGLLASRELSTEEGSRIPSILVDDPLLLLQPTDVARLRSIVLNHPEETRQSQFLALTVVYFLSVLMVSKYRDLLEPDAASSPTSGDMHGTGSPAKASADSQGEIERKGSDVSSSGSGQDAGSAAPEHQTLPHIEAPRTPSSAGPGLSERVNRSLASVSPLLREILVDFGPFLAKVLVGSHGQELLSPNLLTVCQTASPVELVMLLCSQEWQSSLQKNAGTPFIELVNEGRMVGHATREHIVRVAAEAEFLLNRSRAEDVQKHGEFTELVKTGTARMQAEEKLEIRLVEFGRKRDRANADRVLTRASTALHAESPPSPDKDIYRLDSWEDDSRRRRRLVPHNSAPVDASGVGSSWSPQHREKEQEALSQLLSSILRPKSVAAATPVNEDSHGVADDELVKMDNNPIEEVAALSLLPMSLPCLTLMQGIGLRGTLVVTRSELIFDMDPEDEENRSLDPTVLTYAEHRHAQWRFNEMRAVFSRHYRHRNTAVEIFVANRSSFLFVLPESSDVRRLIQCLPRVGIGVKYSLAQTRRASLATPRQIFRQASMTQRWQRREISNLDYLIFLNTVAGRTLNDLSQYPVFPWVLSNYDSESLDLTLSTNYRDLSRPVGTLSPSRQAVAEQCYEDGGSVRHNHRTHYSSVAIVLGYLGRLQPFSSLLQHSQDKAGTRGAADLPLVQSVGQLWKRCQEDPDECRELIPEFFYMPEMLEGLEGSRGQAKFGTVELPPWAQTSEDFVRINRLALESEWVSCQLHHWIDLVFGYKQRGPEAISSVNLFPLLSYVGSIDWSQVTEPHFRRFLEHEIGRVGQTPHQLLTEPHPPRNPAPGNLPAPLQSSALSGAMKPGPGHGDVCMMARLPSSSPLVVITAATQAGAQPPAVVTVGANQNFGVHPWSNPVPVTTVPGQQQSQSVGPGKPLPHPAAPSAAVGSSAVSERILPLNIDPHIVQPSPAVRRYLGDNFDQRVRLRCVQIATTPDNKTLFACGYLDMSFHVYALDSGQLMHVIRGHTGLVTCLARSECNLLHDCFVATGSEDRTVMLWLWSSRQQSFIGDLSTPELATPRLILSGHQAPISCVMVSSELGIVVSGAQDGRCLMHSTHGDLLRRLAPPNRLPPLPPVPLPVTQQILFHREGYICALFDSHAIAVYSINGKLLATTGPTTPAPAPASEPLHPDTTQTIVLSYCGNFLLAGTENGQIWVLRTHSLDVVFAFPRCDVPVRSVAITHDQKFVLAGLNNGCVVVFNVDFTRWNLR